MATRKPIDDRSPKEAWDEQHRLLAEDPISWTLTVDRLIRAFEVLAAQAASDNECTPRAEPNVRAVVLMLGGFAIENLIKAIIVSIKGPWDENGKFRLGSHDLLDLSKDAGLDLTDDDFLLFERLEQFTVWAGRYPAPKGSDAMRPRTFGQHFAPLTYGPHDDYIDQARSLIQVLRSMLPPIDYRGNET